MFSGFLIGTLCLVGLIRVLFGRRFYGFRPYGGYGYGYAYGPPPWGLATVAVGATADRTSAGGGDFLYSILARLDATPAQERAIFDALDELKDSARGLRGTVRETRSDVARTVSSPTFDAAALDGAERRVDGAVQELRRAAGGTLRKMHGVLDDRQRKVLGDMIERGWGAC